MYPSHPQQPDPQRPHPQQPHQPTYGHNSPYPGPVTQRVNIGKYRLAIWIVIALWFGSGAIIMVLGPLGVLPHPMFEPMFEDVDPREMPYPLMPFVALAVMAGIVAMLPSRLAKQWVEVDGRGVTLVQQPYWWARGGTLYLPWEAIAGYRSYWKSAPGSNKRDIPKLTITAHGEADGSRLPSWVTADLVGGYHLGLSRWGRNRVHEALRAVRPDLDRSE